MRSDRPKYASGSFRNGPAEEYKATADGIISNFGSYSVDEASKTLILRFEASSFPNVEGTEAKRPFTIVQDDLKYTYAFTAGEPLREVVWRRAK
jgi:hypothetical protein